MEIQTQPILIHDGAVQMVLKCYGFNTAKLPVEPAKHELSQIINNQPDANATWGYFPEIPEGDIEYAKSKALAHSLKKVLARDDSLPAEALDLAFVRLATAEPDTTFGGVHVDVSPGIGHAWQPGIPDTSNILRVLCNVHDQPRTLEYYPHTADELRAKGHNIPAKNYRILTFPDKMKSETIEIPAMGGGALYSLQFLSNKVPHSGRTDQAGHFLVSYGGYVAGQFELT